MYMLPTIKRVLGFFPYRTYKGHDTYNRRIFETHYSRYQAYAPDRGAEPHPIELLEQKLASIVGMVDNHCGWMVETNTGDVFYFGFNDWQFSISKPVDDWEKIRGFIPNTKKEDSEI
jgi:hypothetical protein